MGTSPLRNPLSLAPPPPRSHQFHCSVTSLPMQDITGSYCGPKSKQWGERKETQAPGLVSVASADGGAGPSGWGWARGARGIGTSRARRGGALERRRHRATRRQLAHFGAPPSTCSLWYQNRMRVYIHIGT